MTHLKIGDTAPAFSGETDVAGTVSLTDYQGKKLLIYFYPKDMTPGCTSQACNLTEYMNELKAHGVEVLGVSADSKERHLKFRAKYKLNFPLLVDEDKEVINAFGVFGQKKFMGKTFDGIHRISFLVDENGKIEGIWGDGSQKVKTKEHAQQIINHIKG